MNKTLSFLLLIGMLFVIVMDYSYSSDSSEVSVTAKRFISSPKSFANKNIVMRVKFVNRASIQDRDGFLKCTLEGVSEKENAETIMFFTVYLDSDTLDEWADELDMGTRMIIHAFVDKVNRNWTRLTVYELELDEE